MDSFFVPMKSKNTLLTGKRASTQTFPPSPSESSQLHTSQLKARNAPDRAVRLEQVQHFLEQGIPPANVRTQQRGRQGGVVKAT